MLRILWVARWDASCRPFPKRPLWRNQERHGAGTGEGMVASSHRDVPFLLEKFALLGFHDPMVMKSHEMMSICSTEYVQDII